MDREELYKYKEKTGYSLEQVELDYYQHYILSKLYHKFNTIYFKGGTALQKCYNIKRFSEDLDFNYEKLDIKKIISFIGNTFDSKIFDYNETEFGVSFSIRFKGILYAGDKRTMCKISFDFREGDIYTEPLKKIIRPVYADIDNYFLLALSQEEILAEKVRAIMTRYRARDVYDLNELLIEGVGINYDLINKKLKTYDISFDKKLFKKKINEKESIYDEEMKRLTKIYPSFEECKKRITENFGLE